MWKFTAKYEDWNGNQKERDLFFNITQAELMRFQNTVRGGFDVFFERIIKSADNVQLYKTFEDLIKLSYGEKSVDGERFIKNEEVYNNFKESVAYDVFMEYLMETENGASNFINGIIPEKLRAKITSPEGRKLAAERGIDTTLIK